jgi:hypothetical protein
MYIQAVRVIIEAVQHRVDRVLSFFSSRVGIGTPPTLHPQASVPPTLWFRGEGTPACGRGVGGVPIPTRGRTLRYSVYIALCAVQAT